MAVENSVANAFEDAFNEMFNDDTSIETEVETVELEQEADPEPQSFEEADQVEEESEDESGDFRPVVELGEGQVIRLPDGTEVPVEKAVLFQADYTRKTQELADQRKELQTEREQVDSLKQQVDETYNLMREWYEPRAADPAGWAVELLSEVPDATRATAKMLYDLAQLRRPDGSPVLDPQFVEMFGIEQGEVADTANAVQRDDEVAELRRWKEQQELEKAEQVRIRQQAAQYQQQWDEIKLSHGLDFSSADEERQAKQELLEYIRETGITSSLVDAYDLMSVRRPKKQSSQPTPIDPNKTRASQAVTPRSSSGGSRGKTKSEPLSLRAAISESLSEMAGG
jgi:hypothetical protein